MAQRVEQTAAQPKAEGAAHTVSVIICTKDRETSLRETLATLFAQTRRPDELILVDDGAPGGGALDGEALMALGEAQDIPTRYLKKEQPGLAASRNAGVQHAQGDIILFLDDDVTLEAEYLAQLMALFEADEAGAVGGATGALVVDYAPGVRPFLHFFLLDGRRPGAVLPSGYGVLVRAGELAQPQPVEWLSGCNMAYRRAVFEEFLFDQRLGAYGWSEDRDFSYRVGRRRRLMATPHARLVHRKEPAGRIGAERMGFMETNYLYRFFRKNMPKRPHTWLALGWAMLGIMLRNLLLSAGRSRRAAALARLRGNLAGLAAIPTGKDFGQ